MDWKAYYADELANPANHEAIDTWLDAPADCALVERVEAGELLSFPHTALAYAGPLQARVVNALLAANVERVVALGVLHGIGPTLTAAGDEERTLAARRALADRVTGGFVLPEKTLETAFGRVELESLLTALRNGVRVDQAGVLRAEFSLDTFLALMRRGAERRGIAPPKILPVFIGLTRDPFNGSYGVAEQIAELLSSIDDHRTAIVATGDLVHYGAYYGSSVGSHGVPAALLPMTEYFRAAVDETLHLAWRIDGRERAYKRSSAQLGNDQREMLAVIGALFGDRASHRILSFALSDYSEILATSAPCRVASALVAYGAAVRSD